MFFLHSETPQKQTLGVSRDKQFFFFKIFCAPSRNTMASPFSHTFAWELHFAGVQLCHSYLNRSMFFEWQTQTLPLDQQVPVDILLHAELSRGSFAKVGVCSDERNTPHLEANRRCSADQCSYIYSIWCGELILIAYPSLLQTSSGYYLIKRQSCHCFGGAWFWLWCSHVSACVIDWHHKGIRRQPILDVTSPTSTETRENRSYPMHGTISLQHWQIDVNIRAGTILHQTCSITIPWCW